MQHAHTSVTAALDDVGFGKVQFLLLCYCGLAWLADACETMLLSFLGPAVRCAWRVGPAAESILTSVVFVGMLSGVYSLGVVSDYLGRRRGFLVSALLLGASGLASACAPSFGWLLALRGIVGFALGGTPVAVTLFAEWCPSKGRGKWLLLMQSFWTIGTVMEALLAWAVLPLLGWRWLLALSAAPLGLLMALYPFLPESPHWLVSKKLYADAEAVLRRVAVTNGRKQPLQLQLAPASPRTTLRLPRAAELQHAAGNQHALVRSRSPGHLARTAIAAPLLDGGPSRGEVLSQAGGNQQQHRKEQQEQPADHAPRDGIHPAPARASELLRTVASALAVVFGPQLRRTTLLLYCIWSVNALTYYGLVLLTTALQTAAKKEECTPEGQPNLNAADFTAIIVTTLAEAPGLLAAALLIDGKGRKWTLRAGLMLCAMALGSLTLDPPRVGQLGLLFVARGCIEGTFSCLYIYTPELYPTAVRSVGLALANGFSRLGGFLAPFATVYLVEGGQPHTAEALLGVLCGAAALCAFMLPYETRGRDLQSTELHAEVLSSADSTGRGGQTQRSDGTDGNGVEGDGLQGVAVRRFTDGEVELEPTHDHEHAHNDETGPLLPH